MAKKPHGILSADYTYNSYDPLEVETFDSRAAAMRRLRELAGSPDMHWKDKITVICPTSHGRGVEWTLVPLKDGSE